MLQNAQQGETQPTEVNNKSKEAQNTESATKNKDAPKMRKIAELEKAKPAALTKQLNALLEKEEEQRERQMRAHQKDEIATLEAQCAQLQSRLDTLEHNNGALIVFTDEYVLLAEQLDAKVVAISAKLGFEQPDPEPDWSCDWENVEWSRVKQQFVDIKTGKAIERLHPAEYVRCDELNVDDVELEKNMEVSASNLEHVETQTIALPLNAEPTEDKESCDEPLLLEDEFFADIIGCSPHALREDDGSGTNNKTKLLKTLPTVQPNNKFKSLAIGDAADVTPNGSYDAMRKYCAQLEQWAHSERGDDPYLEDESEPDEIKEQPEERECKAGNDERKKQKITDTTDEMSDVTSKPKEQYVVDAMAANQGSKRNNREAEHYIDANCSTKSDAVQHNLDDDKTTTANGGPDEPDDEAKFYLALENENATRCDNGKTENAEKNGRLGEAQRAHNGEKGDLYKDDSKVDGLETPTLQKLSAEMPTHHGADAHPTLPTLACLSWALIIVIACAGDVNYDSNGPNVKQLSSPGFVYEFDVGQITDAIIGAGTTADQSTAMVAALSELHDQQQQLYVRMTELQSDFDVIRNKMDLIAVEIEGMCRKGVSTQSESKGDNNVDEVPEQINAKQHEIRDKSDDNAKGITAVPDEVVMASCAVCKANGASEDDKDSDVEVTAEDITVQRRVIAIKNNGSDEQMALVVQIKATHKATLNSDDPSPTTSPSMSISSSSDIVTIVINEFDGDNGESDKHEKISALVLLRDDVEERRRRRENETKTMNIAPNSPNDTIKESNIDTVSARQIEHDEDFGIAQFTHCGSNTQAVKEYAGEATRYNEKVINNGEYITSAHDDRSQSEMMCDVDSTNVGSTAPMIPSQRRRGKSETYDERYGELRAGKMSFAEIVAAFIAAHSQQQNKGVQAAPEIELNGAVHEAKVHAAEIKWPNSGHLAEHAQYDVYKPDSVEDIEFETKTGAPNALNSIEMATQLPTKECAALIHELIGVASLINSLGDEAVKQHAQQMDAIENHHNMAQQSQTLNIESDTIDARVQMTAMSPKDNESFAADALTSQSEYAQSDELEGADIETEAQWKDETPTPSTMLTKSVTNEPAAPPSRSPSKSAMHSVARTVTNMMVLVVSEPDDGEEDEHVLLMNMLGNAQFWRTRSVLGADTLDQMDASQQITRECESMSDTTDTNTANTTKSENRHNAFNDLTAPMSNTEWPRHLKDELAQRKAQKSEPTLEATNFKSPIMETAKTDEPRRKRIGASRVTDALKFEKVVDVSAGAKSATYEPAVVPLESRTKKAPLCELKSDELYSTKESTHSSACEMDKEYNASQVHFASDKCNNESCGQVSSLRSCLNHENHIKMDLRADMDSLRTFERDNVAIWTTTIYSDEIALQCDEWMKRIIANQTDAPNLLNADDDTDKDSFAEQKEMPTYAQTTEHSENAMVHLQQREELEAQRALHNLMSSLNESSKRGDIWTDFESVVVELDNARKPDAETTETMETSLYIHAVRVDLSSVRVLDAPPLIDLEVLAPLKGIKDHETREHERNKMGPPLAIEINGAQINAARDVGTSRKDKPLDGHHENHSSTFKNRPPHKTTADALNAEGSKVQLNHDKSQNFDTNVESMASFEQRARIACDAKQIEVALDSDDSLPMTSLAVSLCSGSFSQSVATDTQTLNAALIIIIALCDRTTTKTLKDGGRGSNGTTTKPQTRDNEFMDMATGTKHIESKDNELDDKLAIARNEHFDECAMTTHLAQILTQSVEAEADVVLDEATMLYVSRTEDYAMALIIISVLCGTVKVLKDDKGSSCTRTVARRTRTMYNAQAL